MNVLLPSGWPRPKGYANGVAARGRMVFVAGMIGWDAEYFQATTSSVRQRCRTSAVLQEAMPGRNIVRMTACDRQARI